MSNRWRGMVAGALVSGGVAALVQRRRSVRSSGRNRHRSETLFAYQGVGRLLLDSATAHDLAPLEACVLATAVAVMVANLLADLAASALDPRVRRAA